MRTLLTDGSQYENLAADRKIDEAKYAVVLGRYKPRPIQTEEDNRGAIDALESLHANDTLTPKQEALAEILAMLVEKFEEKRYALRPASSAAISRELLQANGLKQNDLAELVGSKGIASEIINGKRGISRSLAEIFAKRFKCAVSTLSLASPEADRTN